MLKKTILWSLGIIAALILFLTYSRYYDHENTKQREDERERVVNEIASCIAPLLSNQAKMKFAEAQLNMGVNEYATELEEGFYQKDDEGAESTNNWIMRTVFNAHCANSQGYYIENYEYNNYSDYFVKEKLIEILQQDLFFQEALAKLKPIRDNERLVFRSKHLAFKESREAAVKDSTAWIYKETSNNADAAQELPHPKALEPTPPPEALPAKPASSEAP